MNKLIQYSIKHPISVLMYFCLVIFLGAVSPFLLNVNFLPDASERFIMVDAPYQGARAKEIRRLVAIPLEESLSSLKGVKNIESISRDGRALVKIELKWNVDIDLALLEARALLDAAADSLPQDCPKPSAQKKPESESMAIRILVLPKDGNISKASSFVNNELKRRLLALDECGGVKTSGLVEREIVIEVDSNLSSYYGLSLEQIAQEISLSNFDYPAGSVLDGENDLMLKTEGAFKSFDDILDTSLNSNEGPLKARHLAKVKKEDKDFDSFCHYNGERCVSLQVFCKKGKNPLRLSRKIKETVKQANEEKPNYELTIQDDCSKEIKGTVKNLAINSLVGLLIAFFLLLFFFNSVKMSLSIAAVIPFSLLFTCAVLLALKRSLNIISISGMTICLGMIVDNSIVALESACDKKIDAAFLDVRLSNVASTVTSAIVFLPLLFIGGIIGELFLDLAISVASGLLFSLFYSFSALPALCVLFLREDVKKCKCRAFPLLEERLAKVLRKTNKIRFLCPALALAFTILSLLAMLGLKKEMQEKTREKFFCEKIVFPCGADLKLVESKAKALSCRIKEAQGVKNVFSQGGVERTDLNFLANAENKKESVFLFIEADDMKKCKKLVKKILDDSGFSHSEIERRDLISERLEISNNFLFSAEDDDVDRFWAGCEKAFNGGFSPNEISMQKIFKADKKQMERLKLSPYELSQILRRALNGAAASSYCENGLEIPMTVKFKKNEYSAQEKLGSMNALLGSSPVALSSLGEWSEKAEEAALFRLNGKDSKVIDKKNAAAAPFEIAKRLVSLKSQGLKSLFLNGAFLLALVLALLYCILGAQTESLTLPLYYLTAVPPSFFGAAAALLIFGSSLNINSIIALTILFGSSVNNSIVLHESGGKKTSTVFITSATSIASLLPFAFDPLQTNPQSSLSLAVAGGLAMSAAAVLIMTPNMLYWSGK